MEGLRAYILSLVGSALICSCLQTLIGGKSGTAKVINMLCGMYMAFVLIVPLQKIDFSIYQDYFDGFSDAARDAVSAGEIMAEEKRAEIIKRSTETYILEKAISLGADVTVEVALSRETLPVPSGIVIKGAVSPYVKKVLGSYIEEQFGIPEEAQTWKQNAA